MRNLTKLIYSLSILGVMGINPASCSKALKGCRSVSDDVAKNVGKGADNAGSAATKLDHVQPAPVVNAISSTDNVTAGVRNIHKHANGTYACDNITYSKFTDIPFAATDNIYVDYRLTEEEAAYLIQKEVKFVYNINVAREQRKNAFKIIYLISENINVARELYDLDDSYARKLIELSSDLLSNDDILKVASFDEMIVAQDQTLADGKVPVLVFHNNLDHEMAARINSSSNLLTCNSFTINPEGHLMSADFLDMEAIIAGLKASYQQPDLGAFYSIFADRYYNYMNESHKYGTLIYVASAAGAGISVGAGVYAISYYTDNPKKE